MFGETAIDLANVSCVLNDGIGLGGDITIIKTQENGVYLSYYLNFKRNEIAKYAQGISIIHLYSKDFKKVELNLPSINEQNKIGGFLSCVDKKLDLLNQQLIKTQDFKKGLIQQIFTQKIRFKIFKDDWNELKLKDIGKINTGNTPPTKVKEYYTDKGHLWVTPSDITDSKYILNTEKQLSDEGAKKGRFVAKNSVLVTCIASIGKNCIIQEDGYFNQQINSITPKEQFNADFIYYLICYNQEKDEKICRITATPILNKKNFENMVFMFPSIDEQNLIADTLSVTDKKN